MIYRNFENIIVVDNPEKNEYAPSVRFEKYNFQKGISTFEYKLYVKID